MIGVTIAVGEKFRALAVSASEAVRRFYEIEQIVTIGEKELVYCPAKRLFKDEYRHIHWLKFLIPQLVTSGRFLYFDADYRPVRKPDQHYLDSLHTDSRFIAVRDWWEESPYLWPYYNAGFFVADAPHAALFEWCRLNYFQHDEVYGDQDILNRGLATLRVPVLELPREFNAGRPGQCENPVAVHGYWH